MTINKKNLTPVALVSIFLLMLALSFAAVPLYDLFCRVTGFGGTTQNASEKEIPKIIVNQNYKMRFDTNVHSTSDWKFYPEKNTLDLKPGQVHTVKFNVENPSGQTSSGSASLSEVSSEKSSSEKCSLSTPVSAIAITTPEPSYP